MLHAFPTQQQQQSQTITQQSQPPPPPHQQQQQQQQPNQQPNQQNQSYFRPTTPSNLTNQSNSNPRLYNPVPNQQNLNNLHLTSLISPNSNTAGHQQRNLLLGALNSPLPPLSANRDTYGMINHSTNGTSSSSSTHHHHHGHPGLLINPPPASLTSVRPPSRHSPNHLINPYLISSSSSTLNHRIDTPSLLGPSINTPTSASIPGLNTSSNNNHNNNGSNQSGGKLLLAQQPQNQATSAQTQAGFNSNSGPNPSIDQSENEKIYYLIVDLLNPASRELALLELSKKREQWDDLALVLWHSFGVMSCLLQEIVTVYPLLSPPSLTANASNRVCNALALLQCVASHNETRGLFLQAHLPLFLYPFLNTTSKTRPFEYLRLTSLGVIGALVKQNDNSDVINFLLSTEIIPLCLRIMETGSELSKTVAIFIVQKILLDEMGLAYICQTYERFYAVGTVLSNMVNQLVESQAVRLLKHVVRCYLRLSDNLRAREALRACLPEPLRDATFSQVLKGDLVTKRCLASLLLNLSDRVE